ncbi:MAG: alpha-amylase family glycosyl hydrolase, partial [Bacteroidia bacterium]
LLFAACAVSNAQIVSLDPATGGAEDEITLTFDAAAGNGELVGASKIYFHHGVVTDAPDGTDWSYVIGNWGADDGVGEMTKVSGETDKWEIKISPTLREHFGVPAGTNIFRISCVFRSADGNTKGTISSGEYGWGEVSSSGDYYINLDMDNFLSFSAPSSEVSYINVGDHVEFGATASAEVSEMKLFLDLNDGNGFKEMTSVSSGKTISYSYKAPNTQLVNCKVTGTIDGEELEIETTHNIVVKGNTNKAALPSGVIAGINYHDNDDSKVTLVLQAPGKDFGYVVGDFTNWAVLDDYQMNQTPDGEYLWLEVDGLVAKKPYVFQYWIEEDVKIGDPYAEQTADPWNDQWIDEETHPNIPEYTKTSYQYATVLETGQEDYEWSATEDSWERPEEDHLVIYELHIRDFLASHSYNDLIDTLTYIKRLGVDAIELMPISEFEGNESWGYNPSYHMAVDKYYGTKNDLKRFIEAAHQMGFPVILDMVLNHAFGQNPLVKLYWDQSAGKPAADNPWFNQDHVGPYDWGYDFNHESQYTKDYIDRVNTFWIEEYHFDGYRFDFTKGFTQNGPNIDNYDADRIEILKRMADVIWDVDEDAYVMLEHWGPANEENELGAYGMKMWKNRSYDYVPAAVGSNNGNFNNMDNDYFIQYFNSHDERRLSEHMLSEGVNNGFYNVKNELIMYERSKMAAAFMLLVPGPKMIWQFDELGYDIHIDYNGRTGNKPLPWGQGGLSYYNDPLRQHIYTVYAGLMELRNTIGPEVLVAAQTDHQLSDVAKLLYYNTNDIDLLVIGNFSTEPQTRTVNLTSEAAGTWFNYFTGEEITLISGEQSFELAAGEWHVLTSKKLKEGNPEVVQVFDNPVTITPYPFTQNDEITIRFDAKKAWKGETNGLIGASKVYMHSGVVTSIPTGTNLTNVVGTLTDDGLGEMTKVAGEDDVWEITITPEQYYSLAGEDAFRIGMFFRDADDSNRGYGFRDSQVFVDIDSDKPFITIEPASFWVGDEITITFNARKGNKELVGATSVYMHSGAGIKKTTTPWTSTWNNAVGNWGADDGLGKMTRVSGQDDMWEISLTPLDYYSLDAADNVFWMSMVFRSADGSTKGTGTPGEIEGGFIHTDQDFFMQNDWNVSINEKDDNEIKVYPNPTTGLLHIQPMQNGISSIELINMHGKTVTQGKNKTHQTTFDITDLKPGIYYVRVTSDNGIYTKQIVKY